MFEPSSADRSSRQQLGKFQDHLAVGSADDGARQGPADLRRVPEPAVGSGRLLNTGEDAAKRFALTFFEVKLFE